MVQAAGLPDLIAAGARIVSLLHGGGGLAVLAGPAGVGKTAVLDMVLAGMPGRVWRMGNRDGANVELAELATRLAGAVDGRAACWDDLIERLRGEGPVLLVVDDAHTVTPCSLQALLRLPAEVPETRLLLAGRAGLAEAVAAGGGAAGLVVGMAGQAGEAARGPMPRWRVGAGFVAAATVVLAVMVPMGRDGPSAPPSGDVAPAPISRAARTDVGAVAAPQRGRGGPVKLGDAGMRQEFDAFLDRAGRGAVLDASAREELFQEYLVWKAGPAKRGTE